MKHNHAMILMKDHDVLRDLMQHLRKSVVIDPNKISSAVTFFFDFVAGVHAPHENALITCLVNNHGLDKAKSPLEDVLTEHTMLHQLRSETVEKIKTDPGQCLISLNKYMDMLEKHIAEEDGFYKLFLGAPFEIPGFEPVDRTPFYEKVEMMVQGE